MGKIGSFVVLMIFCILFSSMASSVLGETMYCWIRNPYGNIVASDSMSITNCGGSTIDPTSGNCEATCDISTTSACCNISDVWYTWEVYDNPPNICCGGGTCGGEACVDNSAASQTGNAYYVDWGIQTYCTDLCIGKPVGWDLPGYAGECCGDGANEYGIPCLDSGEGYCNTPSTDDEKACCVGTTAGSDCVKDGTCYTVNSQFGEWQCIADPANTWHDIVDPVFDSYSISGCQHEDLSVPLNPVCWVGSGITTQHTIRHTDQGSTPDTQYITFTKDGCVPNTCGCPSTTPPGTFCENETKSWVRIDTGAFVDWMVNDSALDIQQPSCTESGGCTGTAAKEEWPVVSGTDDGEYKIWTFLYDQASNAVGYNYVNWWLGIDNTPPNTGISRSGTLGWNDWYTSNVDVTLTCDDGSGSGCESATMHPVIHYCYSQDPVTPCPTYQISSVDSVTFTISDEGHNYLRYYSEDNVGNTQSEVMIEIKIDKTDPTFNAYDILMGCDYWNESVPSDKICWVKQGTTTTHSITHSDAVSTPSLQYITFTKDGCTPNEGCNPDYPTSFSGREIKSWIDVDTGVLIEWMINDSHLDIAAAGCSIPLPTGCTGNTVIIDWLVTAGSLDGEFKVWTFLHDEAGKGIGYTEVDWWLNVDNTPPATNQILAGTMGLENWYRSNVAVALQCDDGSGSGCSQTKYCVDQINSCVPGTVYTGQFTITAEGINYLRFNSTDNVGNVETTNSVQVKIDKTPPNIWINTLPQWTNTSSFLVSWDNSTDTSEIASFQLQWKEEGGVWTDWVTGEISGAATPGSATFGEAPPGNDPDGLIDTETYFLRINATDKAGNTCDWYEVNTTIDLTLPVCIMDPLPDYSPEVFQISWTGDDFGGSGIDFYNVQYNPNGFGWINAFNVTQEGLTASYSFEDGDGKIAADSSGNGYDGTVYGNTKLLMHLDENGTGAGYDESPYDSTVLLMHLDEGSGLTAGDDSRYRNDGTINGATWGTSGCQSGACLEFGGVNNWIDVPTTIADNADGTVSLWVYIDSSESDDAFIWITSNDGCGTGYKFLKYTSSSSRISATYYDGSFKTIVSDTVIDKDRWHHLTYSWGSAGQRLYQDGELVAVNTDNTGQGFAALDHFIGGWGDCSGAGSQYFLDGKIDEVAVHDRALSMSEIRDRYAEGRARLAPKQGRIYGNTRLLMRFDEDKGAATWDESSYGNIGTIYGNTKLLMHLDEGSGNPMDSSPYGNDGTNNGATWQTSGCQSGSCLEFNGNDYVDAGNINLTDTDFSISFWMRTAFDNVGPTNDGIITKNNGSGSSGGGFWIIHSLGSNRMYFGVADGTTFNSAYSNNVINDDIWHHVVGIYTPSNSNVSLYMDGNFINSNSLSSLGPIENSDFISIGCFGSSYCFNGRIDEVSIHTRALSQAEITAMYNEGKAKFTDWVPGQSGSALEFDGVDDYVEVADDASLKPAEITIESWVMPRSITPTYGNYIVSKYSSSWQGGYTQSINTQGRARFNLDLGAGAGGVQTVDSSSTLSLNNWHHIVSVYDGANMMIYVNGVLDDQAPNSGNIEHTTNNLAIGARNFDPDGYPAYFNGIIDEVAIYSRALSQAEITAMYNEGKAKFTDWVPGQSGSGLEFDGVDDYVEVPDDASLDIIDEITIETWFKANTLDTNIRVLLMKGDPTNYELYFVDPDLKFYINGPSGGSYGVYACAYGRGNFNIDTWYHVVATYDSSSGNAFMYVNGNPVCSNTMSGTMTPDADGLFIGSDEGGDRRYFNGTIDEAAVYSRALSQAEITAMYNEGKAKFTDWVPGQSGSALEFDGVDDYVDAGPDFIGTGADTICAWIYPKGWGPEGLGRIVDNDETGFLLDSDHNNLVFSSDGYITLAESAVDSISLGVWQHVCVRRDNAGLASIYIDGSLSGQADQDSGTPTAPVYNIYIGNNPWLNRAFNGTIDGVRIYNMSLSSGEILELASGIPDGFCTYQPDNTYATCVGLDGTNYAFRCRGTDHARNTGAWDCDAGTPTGSTGDLSGCENTTLDAVLPGTNQIVPDPTRKWVNSTDPNDILVKLEWQSIDVGSYINCSYVMVKKCTHLADSSNNGVCSSWGEWYYIMDHMTGSSTNCLPLTDCTGPRGGLVTCNGEALFNGTGINATTGEVVPGDIQELEIYNFSIWTKDEAGNVEVHSLSDPIIDVSYPVLDYDVLDDAGGSIRDKPFVRAWETSTVRISSNTTDSYSGIEKNDIKYYLTQGNTRIFNAVSCGAAPSWGGVSYCIVPPINYGEDTIIKYWIEVMDRAGNTEITDVSYVATHQMVNFIVHSVYMMLGESFDFDVQVRNLQPVFDNVTLMITGPGNQLPDYVDISFLDTGVGNVTGNGYVLEDIGLNPNEEKTVKIRVMSSGIGPEAGENPYIYVNATSTLNATGGLCISSPAGEGECLIDSDEAMVIVGYPAAFPGLSEWAVLILVILAVVIYSAAPIRKE